MANYSFKGENHLLNGILFEIYFNHEGKFRYKNFKISCLNEIMQHTAVEVLKGPFAFIQNLLKEFAQFLVFIPSPKPSVKTISFDGNELLADDEDSNVFPYNKEQDIKEDALKNLLCEGYGIPSSYLDVIYNEEPLKHFMWLDRKFKRNFRGSGKEDELDIIVAATEES